MNQTRCLALIAASTLLMSWIVASAEGWSLDKGIHITVDALMNNGSGKYAERTVLSRLVLILASLLGFFLFIEWIVRFLSSLAWRTTPTSAEQLHAADTKLHAADTMVVAEHQQRVGKVLALWLTLMAMMTATFFLDTKASDEEGRMRYETQEALDRLSEAVLYAISTGCSGGFGHLGSDMLGAAYILVSVPVTAWLAAEVALLKSAWALQSKQTGYTYIPGGSVPDYDL